MGGNEKNLKLKMQNEKLRVALVHDFLTEYGGAERVLEALHEIYPAAPVFTAYYKPESLGTFGKRFKNWKIITNWGQKLPFWGKLQSPYRIFGLLIFESFDFKDFDLVISSTNTYFAKSVISGPKTLHVCYCHTPPRYLYGYPTARDWRKYFIGRIVGETANFFLRMADFAASQRVDYFIANSQEVKRRIEKFYRRDATVIYPPVETEKFKPKNSANNSQNYYLCVSRLARAKRIDLAIQAANKLGFRLKVVGDGRERKNLEKIAGKTVEFFGEVSDKELIYAYQNCKAVIFPAEDEDFGLVPVEAQACGKPVIALKSGGVAESVINGKTGVFFEEPTVNSLIKAIKQFNNLTIHPHDCLAQAEKFSKEEFKAKIKKFVESKIQQTNFSS